MKPTYPSHSSDFRSRCLLAAVAAGGLLTMACNHPVPPAPSVVRPVHTATVQASGGQRTRTFSGVASTETNSSLSFMVAGKITRLAVGVGDRVQVGDPIADLDPVDYELRVQAARAALRQARAGAVNAEADLRRAWRRYENGDGARASLDAAMAAVDFAGAQVESMTKGVEMAERQAAYTRLTAPEAGVIATIAASVNEHVLPGAPVVMLTSGTAPEVRFTVPETLIRRIRQGSRASAVFNAVPGRRFYGVVTEMGVTTAATGTTFPVTIRLDDIARDIRSGMTAKVTIAVAEDKPASRLVVPARAVTADRTGQFVFVIEAADGRRAVVRRRTVTGGGKFSGADLEIVDGLSAGEVIVIAGVSRLQDGDEVRFDPILDQALAANDPLELTDLKLY